jgi:hypothetical protein
LRPSFHSRHEPFELGLIAWAEDETLNKDAVLLVLFEEFALEQQHRF